MAAADFHDLQRPDAADRDLVDERPDFAEQPVGFFWIAEFVDIQLLRMRNFLNAINKLPHPEEARSVSKGAGCSCSPRFANSYTCSRESGVSADREGALGSLYPFLYGTRKDEAGQAGATAPRRSLSRFH